MLSLLRLFALLLSLLPLLARAAGPLVLDDHPGTHDAWPAVTVLADEGGKLDAASALAQAARFEAPRSAYATLGVHKGAVVWVRIPVAVPADASGEWMLHIDYSQLNRVDVFVASGPVIQAHSVTGNLQPIATPAGGGRTPARDAASAAVTPKSSAKAETSRSESSRWSLKASTRSASLIPAAAARIIRESPRSAIRASYQAASKKRAISGRPRVGASLA